MAIITIADYKTLSDSPKRIDGSPNALDLEFAVPGDFVFGTGIAKPVIMFTYKPLLDTTLEVYLRTIRNSDPVHTEFKKQLKPADNYYTIHETMDGSHFVPGVTNKLQLILTNGSVLNNTINDVLISDVVLMYQRRITT